MELIAREMRFPNVLQHKLTSMHECARIEFSTRWFWREFKDELTRGAEGDLNAFDKVNYAMDLTIWGWACFLDPALAALSPDEQ